MPRRTLHHHLTQAFFVFTFVVTMSWFQGHPVAAKSASGVYRGGWQSDTTGHRGPMNVRIRNTSTGELRALFSGRFAGVIPFVYRATLEPTGEPGQFVSERKLPLMGTYRMSAVIGPEGFYARYTSRKDIGSFQMRSVSR